MFVVLHLVDVTVRLLPKSSFGPYKDSPEAVQLGIEILTQSRAGFPVAGYLEEGLRTAASEYSIPLLADMEDAILTPNAPNQMYRRDNHRPSYVQPVENIHKRYISSFCAQWASEETSFSHIVSISSSQKVQHAFADETSERAPMKVDALLNTA
jgi:hypothetical protein